MERSFPLNSFLFSLSMSIYLSIDSSIFKNHFIIFRAGYWSPSLNEDIVDVNYLLVSVSGAPVLLYYIIDVDEVMVQAI